MLVWLELVYLPLFLWTGITVKNSLGILINECPEGIFSFEQIGCSLSLIQHADAELNPLLVHKDFLTKTALAGCSVG